MAWIIRFGSLLVGRMGPALDLTPGNIPDLGAKSCDRVPDPGGRYVLASPGTEDDLILLDRLLLQPLEVSPGDLIAPHRAKAKNSRLRFVRSHELACWDLNEDPRGGFHRWDVPVLKRRKGCHVQTSPNSRTPRSHADR